MACDCVHYTYEQGHPCFGECGGGGGTLSDDQWYEQEIKSRPETFDTNLSKAQWIAWRQYWDDDSKRFRSENVDDSGNAIGGGGFEKPTDCPDGTLKYGNNKCLPVDDPRILGVPGPKSDGAGGGAGGGGGTKAPATPAKPASLAQDQLQYTGNELQDVLANMFNYRAGVFGTGDANLSGATPRTPGATTKGGKPEEIAGTFLPGGGLWWGGATDLRDALAPFGQTFSGGGATAPSVAAPGKPKKKSGNAASATPQMPEATYPPETPYKYPKGKHIPAYPLEEALSMPGFRWA